MLACGLLDVNALMDLKLDTVPYLYWLARNEKGGVATSSTESVAFG